MSPTSQTRGTALCVLSACAFGAMAIFAKEAYATGATVVTLLSIRFLLAAALFWVIVAVRGAQLPSRRVILASLGLGAAGYAAQAGLFFGALTHIDASLTSLLLYLYPMLVFLGAVALRREHVTGRRVGALALASVGAALVLMSGSLGALDGVGVAMALGAAVVYAAYILVADRLIGTIDAFLMAALVTTGAAASTLVAGLGSGSLDLRFAAAGWGWIAAPSSSCSCGRRVRLRVMSLPLTPPLSPQLARSRTTLPEGDGWAYEPKLDGFRALVFVDGESVEIASRNGKPLDRYFPEVVASLPAGRYVLDGEIVASSFDTLGQRIHPAKSRIERLSVETPARMVAFDLLALDDDVLLERPYRERRAALEAAALDGVELTPVVWAASEAQDWLLNEEGVIAKEADAPYLPGERTGMVKIKRVRTIDAVVLGWRPGKLEGTVGALILGLYEPDGTLRGVGHTSGFSAKEKRELPAKLQPYETGERGTGEPSRWSAGRDLSWVGLRPELVVEVTFDHVSDNRIRHGAKVQRWRDDKEPSACTVDQLEQ